MGGTVPAGPPAIRRLIPRAVLFTRTSTAIQPRTLRHIRAELDEAGVPTFAVEIVDREAYRAIFSYGGTVAGLAEHGVSNLRSAAANARAFAAEVVERLRGCRRTVWHERRCQSFDLRGTNCRPARPFRLYASVR